MKLQLFSTISVAAVISYFVPMLLVLFRKLWRDPFFMLFAAYWGLGGIVNLTDIIPGVPKKFSYDLGVYYNMLDLPFILGIFYCTSSSAIVRKLVPFTIVLIVVSEIISVNKYGVEYDSLKYPLGLGIATVLFIVILEIIRYMQRIEHTNRQNAKMFIYAAVLFEYATFIVIYIFDYFVSSEDSRDSYIIYYLSTMVAILIASCGYLLFRKYEKSGIANGQW